MTIHITPEPSFSYVSFESNVSASNYGELINRVIETFQPGKFVVTVFANKVILIAIMLSALSLQLNVLFQASPAFAASRELDYAASIGKWKRKDIQYCRFPTYDLTYAHYCKFPSWGLQVTSLPVGANHFPSSPASPPPQALIPRPSNVPSSSSLPHIKQHSSLYCALLSHLLIALMNAPSATDVVTTKSLLEFLAADKTVDRRQIGSTVKPTAVLIQLIVLLGLMQLIPFVLVYCIEECSPLVLFSWWRNKISWECLALWFVWAASQSLGCQAITHKFINLKPSLPPERELDR